MYPTAGRLSQQMAKRLLKTVLQKRTPAIAAAIPANQISHEDA
jgi:hypothetical protein